MWAQYVELSKITAKYPGVGSGRITYPAMGLAGECLELKEKVENAWSTPKDVMLEGSDVAWYGGRTFEEIGKSIDDSVFEPVATVVAHCTHDALYYADRACIASGKVLEMAKKAWRDNEGVLTEDQKNKVADLVTTTMQNVAACIICSGGTMERALELNVEKITSRMQRGVIGGSGDNR